LQPAGFAEAQIRTVRVSGQPFHDAIEAQVDRPTDPPSALRLTGVVRSTLRKGDVVHARLWARCLGSATGSARIGVGLERDWPPLSKLGDVAVTVGSTWQRIDLPIVAGDACRAGEWQIVIRLGYAPQRIQIGGVRVLNYRHSIAVDRLPKTPIDYRGRYPDAAWRKEALERIELIRKSEMRVKGRRSSGEPVPDAEVRLVLVKHDFGFGTCVSTQLLDQGPDGEKYRQKLLELFNHAVIENDLKWPNIARQGYEKADRLVEWLRKNGFKVRGHCLVWPGSRYLPAEALALRDRPDELREIVAKHVVDTVTRYRGRLIDWDVVNEPYSNHLVMDSLGDAVMVEWFRLAHAADPQARLYLNDFEILASGDVIGTYHQEHYYKTAKLLLDRGAPLHGVGMQGHFGTNLTSPENLLKILDRFASLGVRIKVTEMDVDLEDERLRADYLRDFLIAVFSHPAVDAILQWGFWEGSHWLPSAALFRRDWTARPHGQAYIDLVPRDWRTDVSGRTDRNGEALFRGFHGDYDVEVAVRGKVVHAGAQLHAGGGEISVEVP
jgi:GH35 family endo-1,4-beta-xylanase